MQKHRVGDELFVYTDEFSEFLDSAIDLEVKSVTVHGTIGEFKEEALAALLQIAPALFGKVYGLTIEGLQAVANKYDLDGETDFAKRLLADGQRFEQVMKSLIAGGFVRSMRDGDELVYFPTRKYLAAASLCK